MKKLLTLIAASSFAGCALPKLYSGPKSEDSSAVSIMVSGIVKHAAYPNDVVWVHMLDETMTQPLGSIKFTTKKLTEKILLDNGRKVILRFVSVESHFGGYSSCAGDVPVLATRGAAYFFAYSTSKWSCSIVLSQSNGTGPLTFVSRTIGNVGGIQFRPADYQHPN